LPVAINPLNCRFCQPSIIISECMFVQANKINNMEIYHLQNDLHVFGRQVKTFPIGIAEAFEALAKMLPGGFARSYYGLCYGTPEGKMVYIAAALENETGEAQKYNCERYTIEKGEYVVSTVNSWRDKTDRIQDVFREIIKDSRTDNTKPAIEWYKDDKEMMCMVKSKNETQF
jgi:predicted transcriptional regulator YdeE